MTAKDIASLIPTMSSIALVDENIKVTKKKVNTKDMLNLGMKNIVGLNLIKVQSDLVSSL